MAAFILVWRCCQAMYSLTRDLLWRSFGYQCSATLNLSERYFRMATLYARKETPNQLIINEGINYEQ